MNEHLIITKEQADAIRGNYGIYSAIEPVALPDGTFIVPEVCLNDVDLVEVKPTLETMTGNTQPIEELPVTGEPVYSGRTYYYASEFVLSGYSQFVICRQDHTRTIYEPYDTPALFTFTRPDATGDLEWIQNEYVYSGWTRIYSGVSYSVIQEHLTQLSWIPPLTLGVLWAVVPVGNEWAVGVAYSVDQEVTYEGDTYKCLQAHTSQLGWEPPNVPALWQLL